MGTHPLKRCSVCRELKPLSEFYIYKDGRKDPLWHVETMKLPPLERMKARSKTFQGVADAMAEQWG